jgi:hypothetical protein
MRSPVRPLLALAALALAAAPTLAADAPKAPPMFVVHVEQAKPSTIAEYEATTKEFASLVKANHQLSPKFFFNALQGEDFDYVYITPIQSFADLDSITGGFMALGKSLGDKWTDLMHRGGVTSSSYSEGVYMEMTDASYWPANPRVTRENAGYFEVNFYRIMPGMDDQVDAIAAGWKKLYEDHKIASGYTVYRMVLGDDNPVVVVSVPAKDPVDLAQSNAEIQKALGDSVKAQLAKTLAVTRSFETRHYWARPDLSMMPPTMAH